MSVLLVENSSTPARSAIRIGDLIINRDKKTVEVAGSRVHHTKKEFGVLELLCLRKGTTVTKDMFLNYLYGGLDEPNSKIIDVFICKLRQKLEYASNGKKYIETIWGRGYLLSGPSDDGAQVSTLPAARMASMTKHC